MSIERTLHECEKCGKKFLTKLQLRGHTSTHSEFTLGDAA